jgi:hypothetical protein
MATFVEKYVRQPIEALDEHSVRLLDLSISSRDNHEFKLRLGDGKGAHEWMIRRTEITELSAGEDEDEE